MIQSSKTNVSSEAFKMWSLIKTSLQFKHMNFCRCAYTHTLLLQLHGCFLQMKIQCKPQKCCSLEGLTFSIAENPCFPHQKCWCTNFPGCIETGSRPSQDWKLVMSRAQHSPLWHLQAQRTPSASTVVFVSQESLKNIYSLRAQPTAFHYFLHSPCNYS